MDNSNFEMMSKDVAKRFLQTVVVVDDEAEFPPKSNIPKDKTPPARGAPADEDATSDEEATQGEVPKWKDRAHRLDAKEVTDAFAEQGLVCGILRPQDWGEVRDTDDEASLLNRVAQVTGRSDLVVLDWDIAKDGGKTTRQIIKRISDEDTTGRPARLRLIAVYTGVGDLNKIADSIDEVFKSDVREEDELLLRRDPIRVVVYAKENAINIGPHGSRRISFQALPERLIGDFAKMTKGIIPNVAVESLSVLRDNTYSLLTRLHSGFDSPYLAHRLLISEPDDAAEFLISFLTSELRGVLEGHNVARHASADVAEAWLDTKHDDTATFRLGNAEISVSQVKEWVRTGFISGLETSQEESAKKLESVKNNHFRKLTGHLGDLPEDEARKLDMRFAMLTSLRTRYERVEAAPILTLGTIIEDITQGIHEETPRYWLCIQPRCDSVRLGDTPRQYPLLPYKQIEGSNSNKFDQIIEPSMGTFIRLELVTSPSQWKVVPFTRSGPDDPVVRAIEKEEGFLFMSEVIVEADGTGNDSEPKMYRRCYRWIADLKYEQAQRDMSGFATNMSRIGFDEFEWLRRSKGRNR